MKARIRITEAEWEVMEVVWERAPVAASAVAAALEQRRGWTLATVRTLLRRLVSKGALEHREDGKRFLYAPRVTREQCARWESETFASRFLGRAPAATLLHLVRRADLSKEDLKELRRILRDKEKES